MRAKTSQIARVLILVLVVSLLQITAGEVNVQAAVKTGTFNVDKDALPFTEEQIFEQLFDIQNKVEINLDISKAELLKLQKDYEKYDAMGSKSPIYRMGDMYVTITTSTTKYTYVIEQVGIRMKGNTTRNDFYDSSRGIYNMIHYKIDFQETFTDEVYYGSDAIDWTGKDAEKKARKNRTFATLEKFEMKWNSNYDNTYIREYYTYEMYRANGVLAPHTNIASTDVSGTHLGVYKIYEPIDKIFINKNLPEEEQGGDLYKCGWTMRGADFTSGCSIGIEDEDAKLFYNYDLKTNKKTSENTALKNLLSVMNSGSMTREKFESVVDVDNFMLFAACSYFSGNPDDLRNNYNNYYVYFLPSNGKAVLIPYDLDRTMGVTDGYNPSGNGMTAVSPFSNYAQGTGQEQKCPLYKYSVTRSYGLYKDEFSLALVKVANSGWMSNDTFNKYYTIAQNHYANNVKPSKDLENVEEDRCFFSLTETAPVNSSDRNMSFSDFSSKILQKYPEELTVTTKSPTITTTKKSYTPVYGTTTSFDLGIQTDSDGKISCGSSDTSVATVTSSGKVYVKGPGVATITIRTAETTKYLKGTYTVTVTVKPKKPEITFLKSGSIGKFTVHYTQDSTVSGYRISYATKPDFSDEQAIGKASNTIVSVTKSGLVGGQTYYVRVRSYVEKNGVRTYGVYSDAKTVKVLANNLSAQTITTNADSFKKEYGDKAFSLGASAKTTLSYKCSDTSVATVSSTGNVTIKGYGQATITITAAASDVYSEATKNVTVKVVPKTQVVSKVTSSTAGKASVVFTTDTSVTGYKIEYSTDKNFTTKTSVLVSNPSAKYKSITGLKSDTTYYFRVASYKVVGSKTYMGAYSNVASVVVK